MLLTLTQAITRQLWRKELNAGTTSSEQLAPAQAKFMRMAETMPPLQSFSPPLMRPIHWCIERPFAASKTHLARIRDFKVPVDEGRTQIKVRVYYPQSPSKSALQSAMVYFHGGVCVIGSVSSHDLFCRQVAKQANQVVIAVDYRCAPEHKFPVPLQDSLSAWNWVCDNADKLGINLEKTGVGGDSAGGYLATSVCLQTLKPGVGITPTRMPSFQWLIYPMLDLRGQTESYARCTEGMLLTRDLMYCLRDHLLNDASERSNPIASPLLTESLQGLPPALVLTVGHDPLMDEGQAYAQRLQDAGNEVTSQHYPSCMHGFIAFDGVCPDAKRATQEAISVLPTLAAAS